jgi:glyoxylase-like metal-dependent hydrolase (beta-lactamase superfamily II)
MARGETPIGAARGRGRWVRRLLPWLERILRPEPTPPDVLLEDGAALEPFGLAATVLHTPGHTPGSCCLVVAEAEAGALAFVGDLLSATGRPHVQRYFAHDWALIPDSLARLQAIRPAWVYPGHSHPLSGEDLQRL